MEKSGWLLAGVAGSVLFAAGYLAGRSLAKGTSAETGVFSNSTLLVKAHGESESGSGNTRPALRQKDDKKGGYGQLLEMVGKGALRLDGVGIHSESFLPDTNVAEFFGLSEQQVEEMKRIGQERLRKRQEREHETARVIEVSDGGMVVDLPADPDFAASEAAGFVEDLRRSFAPDVVALLEPSIEENYRRSSHARHVRYTMTRRPPPEVRAPIEIRDRLENMWDFEISVNQNEDGTWMTDENGESIGGGSHRGTFYSNQSEPGEFQPRYHDLWKRVAGRE